MRITNYFTYLIIGLLSISQIGCLYNNASKYSTPELLLYKQSIHGHTDINKHKFKQLYKQKENRKLLNLPLAPYLFFYNIGKEIYEKDFVSDSIRKTKKIDQLEEKTLKYKNLLQKYEYDTDIEIKGKKIVKCKKHYHTAYKKLWQARQKFKKYREEGNWWMSSLGEKPVLFDPLKAYATNQLLKTYLRKNGYFQAETYFLIDTVKSGIKVHYHLLPQKAYTIKQIQYSQIPNDLKYLIESDINNAPLKIGQRYQQANIKAQRTYLVDLLKNKGYFYMDENVISFVIDTLIGNKQLDIYINFLKTPEQKVYKKQYIKKVIFTNNTSTVSDNNDLIEKYNITFLNHKEAYKPKLIAPKISIKKNYFYTQKANYKTQLSLSDLNIFRYIHINYKALNDTALEATITTTLAKRYQYILEGGVNTLGGNTPGPFLGLTFRVRNFLGSLNNLQFSTSAALESQGGVTQNTRIYNSLNLSTSLILTFPKVLFPISYKLKSYFLSSNFNTQIEFGLSYNQRPEYARLNFQSALRYIWKDGLGKSLDIDILRLNAINTSFISNDFQDRLLNLDSLGNNLLNSFDTSLVSSFSIHYNKIKNIKFINRLASNQLSIYFESAGNTYNFLNKESEIIKTNQIFGLSYYQYLRLSLSYKILIPFSKIKVNELVFHTLGGLTYAYTANDILPYEKNYFTGGANSNRGWPTRRIGPGSYTPTLHSDGQFDYSFEQPGNITLGFNLEYRRNLVSYIDWAYFIDASNVWTFKQDNSRPGAKFNFQQFWQEFAISTGFGLRLNLTFFILRLDAGFKLYNPAFPKQKRFVLFDSITSKPFRKTTLNIGIGYPF